MVGKQEFRSHVEKAKDEGIAVRSETRRSVMRKAPRTWSEGLFHPWGTRTPSSADLESRSIASTHFLFQRGHIRSFLFGDFFCLGLGSSLLMLL